MLLDMILPVVYTHQRREEVEGGVGRERVGRVRGRENNREIMHCWTGKLLLMKSFINERDNRTFKMEKTYAYLKYILCGSKFFYAYKWIHHRMWNKWELVEAWNYITFSITRMRWHLLHFVYLPLYKLMTDIGNNG